MSLQSIELIDSLLRRLSPKFIKAKGALVGPYDLPPDAGFCLESSESRAFGRFKGKVALITGGAGNFGETCARRLLAEGAKVALFDLRDPQPIVEKLLKEFPGSKAAAYVCDVTCEKTVNTKVDAMMASFGRIDLLFNNAGYQGDFVKTNMYKVADFRRVLDINVTGVFIMLKAVSLAMISQSPRGGSIVNTSSMAGIGVPPNMVAYATSKAAVKHMTLIASKDLAPFDIRVNSVSPAFIGPGFMWTRQVELQADAESPYFDKNPEKVAKAMIGGVPLQRYGSLDEVMGPVLFLLSDDATYLTGVDIKIHGGCGE